MRKTHVLLLIGVAGLSVFMFGLNLKLHRANGQLERQLAGLIAPELATRSPAPGWAMPPLKGRLSDGSTSELDLQKSYHSMVLLLFDPENCATCEANWAYWEKLLADSDQARLLTFVTTAHSIPPEYLQRHHIDHRFVMSGVDASLLKQMRMETAPQTILLEKGSVKKVWFGLLSDKDVNEIRADIQIDD